jgi:hypothetical protein
LGTDNPSKKLNSPCISYRYYLDALLHHFWRTNQRVFPHFQNLLEHLQITSRETRNKKIDTVHILKFLTWTLNINITLIKIIARPPQKTGHQLFTFCYSFQNTFIKLLKTPNCFKPIHVISYKKKYYILNEKPTIFPLLLKNVNPQAHLTYKSITVRADQIFDILKKKTNHLCFPFTINIYTTYSLTNKTAKEIENNMIGQLLAKDSEDVFHVFLTPDIEKNDTIRINALETVKNSAKFDEHNLFVNIPVTEGDKTIFCRTPKEVLLNQKACICDHKETQQYSPSHRYRNLGITPYPL